MKKQIINKKLISKSAERTMEIARSLALSFTGGETVILIGELGAGKTVFAKGIAQGLDISDNIVSPTFMLVREYHGGRLPLYHFDMYRITDEDELTEIGIQEYFDSKSIRVIEWNKLKNVSGKIITVKIEATGDNKREIHIEH